MIKSFELLDLALTELEEGNDGGGFCASCGEYHEYVEPDAQNYECGSCGRREVYGCELIMVVEGEVTYLND
jgi:hypothetical protein